MLEKHALYYDKYKHSLLGHIANFPSTFCSTILGYPRMAFESEKRTLGSQRKIYYIVSSIKAPQDIDVLAVLDV